MSAASPASGGANSAESGELEALRKQMEELQVGAYSTRLQDNVQNSSAINILGRLHASPSANAKPEEGAS